MLIRAQVFARATSKLLVGHNEQIHPLYAYLHAEVCCYSIIPTGYLVMSDLV